MQGARGRLIEDLGDGLIVRHITPADSDELCRFNAEIQADPGMPPEEEISVWTHDLIHNPPPTFTIDDFTVVEDTRTGRIVSTLNLISQTWSYAGIPFGVGQVEIVSTHPDYRRRGLVRRQFEIAHRWSADRGQLVQVVSGIPWYYRQFGYEMCVTHGGGRIGFLPHVPPLDAASEEPFRVRPARPDDAALIEQIAGHAASRYLLSCVRDEAQWRYEIAGHSERSLIRRELRIIESASGTPVGFLAHAFMLVGWLLIAGPYELQPGVSWTAVTPSVLRYLAATGEAFAQRTQGARFQGFRLSLESEHPAYDAIPTRLPSQSRIGAWYMRVPDLARFLRHIAPVLERRLAESGACGYSGDLRLNFYRSGLRLRFDAGRLSAIEPWPDHDFRGASASFPDLTFLQVLFGYRTLEELEHAFADCSVPNEEGRVLLRILFPRQASFVWQVS
ncbi:MAG: GNAT family N-acetyltransferase [Dehalococcoidia bacterium]